MFLLLTRTTAAMLANEEGQGVSEYAMILVLIVLLLVSAVHMIGTNAQEVINKVNSALHIG
jgi:Flp pilus assembly pilin Flp